MGRTGLEFHERNMDLIILGETTPNYTGLNACSSA